ncbi:MAG: hypothetical protein RLZZ196_2020 [Bacteroidota bacterium]|jgi:hypothetical protein
MAIAALSNFTVPLASDQSSATQGLLMPKLQYRFRISFEGLGGSKGQNTVELTKQVTEAARPTLEYEDQTIDIYNSRIHYAGKYKWSPITIKLRDDVNGYVSKLIGLQNQRQFDFYEQSSAASAGEYKFTMRVEMLDGGNGAHSPNVLETWECLGCYIQKTTYGSLAYKNNEVVTIELSIVFDNAVQTGTTAGLGIQGTDQTRGGTKTTGG